MLHIRPALLPVHDQLPLADQEPLAPKRVIAAGAFRAAPRGPRPLDGPPAMPGNLQRRPAMVRRDPRPARVVPEERLPEYQEQAPEVAPAVQPTVAAIPFDRLAAAKLVRPLLAPLHGKPTAKFDGGVLIPTDPSQPCIAMSPVFGRGSFNEVRYGRDEHGTESVWRTMAAPTGNDSDSRYLLSQLQTELMCLADMGSPLLPTRTYLDSDGRFHTEIPVFAGSMDTIKMYVAESAAAMGNVAKASPTAVNTAIRVGKDIAKQMILMHDKGWVHRDMKPENFLYGATGTVLADMGLADSIDPAHPELGTGGFAGTPLFMAPEADGSLGGRVASSFQSDLFSLGMSLADLVTNGEVFRIEGLSSKPNVRYATAYKFNLAANKEEAYQPASIAFTTPRQVYAYVARTNEDFAKFLFGTLLSAEPAGRGTAMSAFARFDALMPEGSDVAIEARQSLDEAARNSQIDAPPSKQAAYQFKILRQIDVAVSPME